MKQKIKRISIFGIAGYIIGMMASFGIVLVSSIMLLSNFFELLRILVVTIMIFLVLIFVFESE